MRNAPQLFLFFRLQTSPNPRISISKPPPEKPTSKMTLINFLQRNHEKEIHKKNQPFDFSQINIADLPQATENPACPIRLLSGILNFEL